MSRLLFINGRVHTPADPGATALLTDGDRIAWVGHEGAALAQRDGVDRVIDLAGALVTPAFVDAHVHTVATGMDLVDRLPQRRGGGGGRGTALSRPAGGSDRGWSRLGREHLGRRQRPGPTGVGRRRTRSRGVSHPDRRPLRAGLDCLVRSDSRSNRPSWLQPFWLAAGGRALRRAGCGAGTTAR